MALLLPTQREKRRYIAIKIEQDYNKFKEDFLEKFRKLFGIYGLAKSGIIFIDDLYKNFNIVVIRVRRGLVYTVLNTLYFLEKYKPHVIGIFPTILQLKRKLNKINKNGND